MSDPLEHIINRPDTWRGMNTGENVFAMRTSANSDLHGVDTLPTGFAALDAEIAMSGWPLRGGVEVLSKDSGTDCPCASLPVSLGLLFPDFRGRRWLLFC